MTTVVLAVPRLTHYRLPLLERLRDDLFSRGIRLRVLYDAENPRARFEPALELDWAEGLRAWRGPGPAARAVWVPVLTKARAAELFIVPEAAGWLATYELLLRGLAVPLRIACWGHGPGHEDQAFRGFTRRVRTVLARRFDWWFTYTDGTRRRLQAAGVDGARITTLYNTLDVRTLRCQVEQARAHVSETRRRLGLRGPTATYIGALRRDKGLEALLRAGARIHERVGTFTLVVAGDGPRRSYIDKQATARPWVRFVGPVHGGEKAALLAASDVMLQPAGLGLVVLDAFAAGLPIVTFDRANHGPEAEYLVDGREGLRVKGGDPERLADAAIALLRDGGQRTQLADAARRAGSGHSIEGMAARFAEGIEQALA